MTTKSIAIILLGFILLTGCNGKNKQSQKDVSGNNTLEQTQDVDTNKIYETWEVDTPPELPSKE